MKIITRTCADLNSNLKLVTRFSKNYQVGLLLKRCNAYKTRGFSVRWRCLTVRQDKGVSYSGWDSNKELDILYDKAS